MARPFRLAILECDTPVDEVRATHGSYGDIFEKFFFNGLKESGHINIDLRVSKWHVVNQNTFPNPESVDAIVLSGSKHTAAENDYWILHLVDFVREFIQHYKKPAVGICFGHQIIARALGSQLTRNPSGWEISVDQITLTGLGYSLLGKEILMLHQMHRDIVSDVPAECVNIGFSSRCAVQGLYWENRVFSIQAHPEFNESIMNSILKARHEQGVFDDKQFVDGVSRASHSHDGQLVVKQVWNFLLQW